MNRMLALRMLVTSAGLVGVLNACASPSITITAPMTGTVVTATGTAAGEVVPVTFTVNVVETSQRVPVA